MFNNMNHYKKTLSLEYCNYCRYEIVATSLSWMPFIGHADCDENGRRCTNRGLLVDIMNTIAKGNNFTWDIYADVDNDWGLFPIDDG